MFSHDFSRCCLDEDLASAVDETRATGGRGLRYLLTASS